MSQTSYSNTPAVAIAGLIADLRNKKVGSYLNKQGAAIPFGVAVARGDAGDRAELPDSASAVILGVVARTQSQPHYDLDGINGVKEDGLMNVLEEGPIWVRLDHEHEVAHDDPVYVRITSDGSDNTQLGTFRNDDDSEKAIRIRTARFTGTHKLDPSGAYLARVELRGFHGLASDIDSTVDALDTRVDTAEGDITTLQGEMTTAEGRLDTLESGPTFTSHVAHDEVVQTDSAELSYLVPTGKVAYFLGASYVNPTGLAEDSDDFFVISTKIHDGALLAKHSTQTGEEGTLAAGEAVELANQEGWDDPLVAGTQINLDLDHNGTQTLPAGKAVMLFRVEDAE